MPREYQPRVEFERMVVFAVVAFEAVLAIDTLLGADEAEIEIAQRHAVVGMPSAQHRARDFAGHAADRSPPPDPARRWIADPGLAVGLVHVFDMHAADPVRQIVIPRGRDRGRQMIEPKFGQPGQEALLLLAAEYPEHEFSGIRSAAPGDHGENEAGEKRMVEIGDAAPFHPLRFAFAVLPCHRFTPVFVEAHCHRERSGAMRRARGWIALTRTLAKLRSEAMPKGS